MRLASALLRISKLYFKDPKDYWHQLFKASGLFKSTHIGGSRNEWTLLQVRAALQTIAQQQISGEVQQMAFGRLHTLATPSLIGNGPFILRLHQICVAHVLRLILTPSDECAAPSFQIMNMRWKSKLGFVRLLGTQGKWTGQDRLGSLATHWVRKHLRRDHCHRTSAQPHLLHCDLNWS